MQCFRAASAGETALQSRRASALGFCSSCAPLGQGMAGRSLSSTTRAVSCLLVTTTLTHDEPSLVPTQTLAAWRAAPFKDVIFSLSITSRHSQCE